MNTIKTKCKVGYFEQTQAQIDEAKRLAAKNAINTETQKQIYTLLDVETMDKAKEVQLNANNEATRILATVARGKALSKEQVARLDTISGAAQKIDEILANGKAKKEALSG